MVYEKVNNPQVWDIFFENADQNKYSIYYHAKKVDIEKSLNIKSKNQHIKIPEILTQWGDISLWLVMNSLIGYSFSDFKNHRFVFVSQSCIPLYNFDEIYEMVFKEDNSRILFSDKNEIFPKYNHLEQLFERSQIVKHHQWIILTRKHVSVLLRQRHRWEYLLLSLNKKITQKWIPDEALFGTLLNHFGQQEEISNKCVTYADWTNKSYLASYDLVDKNLIKKARDQGCLFLRKTKPQTKINEDVLEIFKQQDYFINSQCWV
ncbi:core-2 i-branching beta--n-acetylglucosaminyltransferase family protein [Stylonychia lemnae]|uniref:Core-2 i-branching beta--n-acetylglucosaminyltransferase family protein n=1 Tax=Stylonychia lemnae TaxID=5949 RepID=A0A078AHW0_STYLE|nr:core-2 i-branching beta--n-acetylglucosaminyltransferase family protein [Stylonychia lemnae]|eukprot:CDW81855.1 core-2 i-branching beta--n-acetylglucosaminyltransferase family protein [Stylonychia lemnae]